MRELIRARDLLFVEERLFPYGLLEVCGLNRIKIVYVDLLICYYHLTVNPEAAHVVWLGHGGLWYGFYLRELDQRILLNFMESMQIPI